MSKKQIVGSMLEWSGVLKDFFRQIDDGSIGLEEVQTFLEHKNPFVGLDYSLILSDWEKFFSKIYGMKVDFAGVSIPKADDNDFPWFVCKPENFSTERAFSGGKKQFAIWKHTNKSLDDVLNLSFGRDAQNQPYIIRCRPNYEADEDLENLSADVIVEQKINTMTLKERLLLGRFIYWKMGKHLDIVNVTLCSGSRYSDCSVPWVYWGPDALGLIVFWCRPGRSSAGLRSRRAVL